jgi:lantibiotic modifying enzyme
LDAAVDAGRWIRSTAIVDEHWLDWPADPDDPKSVSNSLYSGSPGVVLFFLELARATSDPSWLEDAKRGADRLIATLPDHVEGEACGLYTGVAGVGFVLEEVHRATGDERYRKGAVRCIDLLAQAAEQVGDRVKWSATTDIISGSSGIGLFLLYASREMHDPRAPLLAGSASTDLAQLSEPTQGGARWRMDPTFPREMPNFSHGTAGVAYFLATSSMELDGNLRSFAAPAGAMYLHTIADTSDGGCRIYHHDPDGKTLYYLGWCHGPVGTAPLFYVFERASQHVLDGWTLRCGQSLLASGIPEQRTPGFWNNVGQCCGSAGVAEFALDLYAVTHDPKWRVFARRMADDVLARGTRDEHGLRWIQAEHRVKPDLLVAQTGWMQGAAGIGHMLLRFDALDRGRKLSIRMPDSPFEL